MKKLLPFIISIIIIGPIILYSLSNKIIFKPNGENIERNKINSPNQEVTIFKNSKLEIKAILLNQKESKKIIVYFHGNVASNNHIMINKIDANSNFHIISPSYPGYHSSTGNPSPENLYLTADKVIEFLLKNGYKEKNIIIFGVSLGGAAAVYSSAKYKNLNRTILVNNFDSIFSICLPRYHIFCSLSYNILNSNKYARNISGKVIQFHSMDDKTIGIKYGRLLFDNIGSKDKKFIIMENANHNDFSVKEVFSLSGIN